MKKHHLIRFEGKREPLISRAAFARRLARNFGAVSILIGVSLAVGMAGYAGFEGMSGVDAFVNAAMILSGMGPLSPLQTVGGKLFAGFYALYSGLALVLASAMVLAPVVHRLFHHFHLEEENAK
jgi:hypothetical protein